MCPKHSSSPIRTWPLYKQEQGFGLPAAIFVITVLSLVVLALNSLDEVNGISFSQDINSQRAFYAAESGAHIGLNRLFPAGGSASDCSNSYFSGVSVDFAALAVTGLNNCSARVNCQQDRLGSNSYFMLESEGVCGIGAEMATRRVRVRVKQ
ncbi:MAG: pilus assembly PilX N-terminal domain-containing protein [Hahellaceae bacterium]|nr:pilus assembly PilX N-terminal domain-containing protein [Hahellaceae bacterium]MCP5168590.1 pilus assembly PilX N-terminal domain-containing protein [Hahellaceae bacterium]